MDHSPLIPTELRVSSDRIAISGNIASFFSREVDGTIQASVSYSANKDTITLYKSPFLYEGSEVFTFTVPKGRTAYFSRCKRLLRKLLIRQGSYILTGQDNASLTFKYTSKLGGKNLHVSRLPAIVQYYNDNQNIEVGDIVSWFAVAGKQRIVGTGKVLALYGLSQQARVQALNKEFLESHKSPYGTTQVSIKSLIVREKHKSNKEEQQDA